MSMSELFDFSGMGSHLLWVSIRILRFGMGFDGWNPQIRSPKPPNPQIGSPKPQIGSLSTVFVDREFDHQVRRSEIEGGKEQIY
ncbi:hypothetical protein ACS0TY_003337 [Phlomoides rotata]